MSLRVRSQQGTTAAVLRRVVFLIASFSAGNYSLAQSEVSLDPNVPVAVKVRPETPSLRAYRDAVSGAESSDGAYAAMLPEQLLSLGLALQKEGRHADALTMFKRGAHLARINDGLYSAEQIAHIQNKINSHLALGELDDADKSQGRLFRIQRRNMGNGEAQIEALMQQARWQQQAYALGIGGNEFGFSRLMNMWDLNRLALTNIIDREGDKSSNLLPPLFGMLQAQYLISGHTDGTIKTNSDFNTEIGTRQNRNRFNSYRSKSYEMGKSIIRGIYDIQTAQHGEKSLPAVQARIMMGDWMLWHGARDPAMDAYVMAIGELAERNDAQLQAEKLLGAPAALPDLVGVRGLPPEVNAEEGNFLVEFGVTAGGKVVDLVRLQETEDEENDAAPADRGNRLMRALRKTKFRPRFANGEAIQTEKIVKAYVIAQ